MLIEEAEKHYASKRPPVKAVLALCERLGCHSEWLPDSYGVEHGPSERVCRRCKRYIRPGTDEPFRSDEEVQAWMALKLDTRRIGYIQKGSLWLFEGEKRRALLRCVYTQTSHDNPHVVLELVIGTAPQNLIAGPIPAEQFVEQVLRGVLALLEHSKPPWDT